MPPKKPLKPTNSKNPKKRAAKGRMTPKTELFVDHYLSNGFNGKKARIDAGYSPNGAAVDASQMIRKPHVQERIRARLAEVGVTPDEIKAQLAFYMRGDITDLLDDNWQLDLALAKQREASGLIKKLRFDTVTGRPEAVELHDNLRATMFLADIFGLRQAPKENDADHARKALVYERLVERVTARLKAEGGIEIERAEAIERIAAFDPLIRSYLLQ